MNKNGNLGIIIALSIAMLGATTVVTYGALQVEAAATFCYSINGNTANICVVGGKKSDCIAESQGDARADTPGKCFNEKKIP